MSYPSRPADAVPALTPADDRPGPPPSAADVRRDEARLDVVRPVDARPAAPALLVACLCAAWCRVCEDYRPAIVRVADEFPDYRFVDLDIEDHEALVDGLDIEQFPTFLMAAGDEVRFFGPLPPQPEALRLTVRAAAQGICVPTEAAQLAAWRRIRDAIEGGEV